MILIYWKDLLLKSRIKECAQAISATILFAKNPDELDQLLTEHQQNIKRVIVELNAGPEIARALAAKINRRCDSVGVISHVDIETQTAAQDAGFTKVIPRSKFVQDLERLLSSI